MRSARLVGDVTTLVGTPARKERMCSTLMANIRSMASTLLNAACDVKVTLRYESKR